MKHLIIQLSTYLPFLFLCLFHTSPVAIGAEDVVVAVEGTASKVVDKNSELVDGVHAQTLKKRAKKQKRKIQKWMKRFLGSKKNRRNSLLTLLGGGLFGLFFGRKIKQLLKKHRPAARSGNGLGCIMAILLLALCTAIVKWLGVDPILGLALFVVLGLIYFVIKANNS